MDEKFLDDNFIKSVNYWNGEENIYLLINYKDLNNNSTKEICIPKSELEIALKSEYNISRNEAHVKLENFKSRTFVFKQLEAITILNKYYYLEKELSDFKNDNDINKIIDDLKNKENWFLDLDKINFKENLYAYFLTKRGFIINISYECFGPSGLWCVSCQKE